MTIEQNIAEIKSTLPADVKLVAVSKTFPDSAISEAYGCGQRAFAENRPQELAAKRALLPDDIEWHFIGSLQTNKVKQVVPCVSLIHSIDSARLLEAVDARSALCGRVTDVLFELHVARESSKHGWDEEELMRFVDSGKPQMMSNIRLKGVMSMASFTDDVAVVRSEFRRTRAIFERLRGCLGEQFDTVSMGMSGDYKIAVEEGTTLVRVGSSIFGRR